MAKVSNTCLEPLRDYDLCNAPLLAGVNLKTMPSRLQDFLFDNDHNLVASMDRRTSFVLGFGRAKERFYEIFGIGTDREDHAAEEDGVQSHAEKSQIEEVATVDVDDELRVSKEDADLEEIADIGREFKQAMEDITEKLAGDSADSCSKSLNAKLIQDLLAKPPNIACTRREDVNSDECINAHWACDQNAEALKEIRSGKTNKDVKKKFEEMLCVEGEKPTKSEVERKYNAACATKLGKYDPKKVLEARLALNKSCFQAAHRDKQEADRAAENLEKEVARDTDALWKKEKKKMDFRSQCELCKLEYPKSKFRCTSCARANAQAAAEFMSEPV